MVSVWLQGVRKRRTIRGGLLAYQYRYTRGGRAEGEGRTMRGGIFM
jgi:hypothetical protein